MLLLRNKLSQLIILSSAIIILFSFFMLNQNYKARDHQKETLAKQMHQQVKQIRTMQLRMGNSIDNANSVLKNLQPDFYSDHKQGPDSIMSYLKHSEIDFAVQTDQYFIPLASYPQNSDALNKLLPASTDIFKRNPTGEKRVVYYSWSGDILYEISGFEIIHADSSLNRLVSTYLFLGQRFGQQQLDDFTSLTGGRASLVKEPSLKISPSSDDETLIQIPLYGTITYPVASIQLRTSPAIIKSGFRQNTNTLLWGVAGMILLIAVSLFFIRRYYLLPMKELKLVLVHNDPQLFDAKLTGDEDYKVIKNQVLNLFSQQNFLAEFLKRRPSIHTLELHSAILEQINEVVYVTNCDDEIIFWNHAAEKYYNIPQQSALQQSASALIPIKWESATDSIKMNLTLKEQGYIEGYFSQSMPSGETRQVKINVVRMFDCTNIPTGNIYILNG